MADSPSMSHLADRLAELPGPDHGAVAAVTERAATVLRPPGALQWLDDVAAWKAGWQRSTTPTVERPAVLVFAGDHGVAAAGVSNYPSDVTGAMLTATQNGQATINAFARSAGASVTAIDVGVGDPTGDMRTEAALTTGAIRRHHTHGVRCRRRARHRPPRPRRTRHRQHDGRSSDRSGVRRR